MPDRTPPFLPAVNDRFDPIRAIGIIPPGGARIEDGRAIVSELVPARDATIRTALVGTQRLLTTEVTITAIASGVDHRTEGAADGSGTDLTGLGGVLVRDTTRFDVRLQTANQTLRLLGRQTLDGVAHYIGTDGTLALVEIAIAFPASLASLLGNSGMLVLDAVLSEQPFLPEPGLPASGAVFDMQGALLPA